MYAPAQFNFSQFDQRLLSTGTATRLFLACVLGGAVGLEREWRRKASGLRTNMLLCMGCAFFTLLSAVLAGENNPDKGRVASNIVQGIGFLGAGLILHSRNRIVGMTSAATVFAVASIGMACGAGLYVEAVLATMIVIGALVFVGLLEAKVGWQRYPLLYEMRGPDDATMVVAAMNVLDRMGERLNIISRDSIATMERMTFLVSLTRRRHQHLLAELRASASTDQVVAFTDEEG